MDAFSLIKKVLEEQFGMVVLDDEKEDFAISDYLTDSIMFIEFINSIENEIGKELPDDFLLYEALNSAKGFSEKLSDFVTSHI